MSRGIDTSVAFLRASLATLAFTLHSGLRSGVRRRYRSILTALARIWSFRRLCLHANTESVLEDELGDDGLDPYGDAGLSRTHQLTGLVQRIRLWRDVHA